VRLISRVCYKERKKETDGVDIVEYRSLQSVINYCTAVVLLLEHFPGIKITFYFVFQIVYGEIYYVDDEFMGYLDTFEGCPVLYQRNVITICSQSQSEHEVSGTQSSSVVQQTLNCSTYMRKQFDQALLSEQTFSSYDSSGLHGQSYRPQ